MKALLVAMMVAVLLVGCSLQVQTTTIVVTVPVGTLPVSIGSATATPGAIPQFGIQLKTTGCQVRGPLPDPECTPGAIFPDATVSQICTPGYASSVRNVPTSEKDQVY